MLGWFSPKVSGLILPFFLLFTSSGSSADSLPIPDAHAQERTALASTFTAEKLWFWQKRLNLEDWKLSVLVVRSNELKPKTLGNIHWDSDKKTAVIRVLDPSEYQMPFHDMLDDMEFTVVHELIHLELSSVLGQFSRDEANRREEEHAVNHMAEALLKLQRGR